MTIAIQKRRYPVLSFLIALNIGLLVLATVLGSYDLTLQEIWIALTDALSEEQHRVVVWEFRIPRALTSIMAGMLLALSGALLQGLTRNPLADPSIVGVSQGAALAVVTAAVYFPDTEHLRPWFALFGSFAAAFVIMRLTATKNQMSTFKFILVGIGLQLFIGAMTSAILTYGKIESAVAALTWMSGSLHAAEWKDVLALLMWSIVLIPITLVLARYFPIQALGDDLAMALGTPLKGLRQLQVLIAVAAAAITTSVVGPLGFIGLLAPNIAKRLPWSSPQSYLFMTLCIGALIVGFADLLGRLLFAPTQLPAGIVSALIGAPVLIIMLKQKMARGA